MNSTLAAALRSWPFDPWLLAGLVVAAAIYARGWRSLRRRDPIRWQSGKLAAFCGGLAVIFLALASPIEPFSAFLLSVHMTQHVLLMMVAPPLIWLGAPLFPLLRGLPRAIRTYWVAPLFRSPTIRGCFARLAHPALALPLYTAANWLWHVPALYDLALRSAGWHYVQHLCFLGTALFFWYPVVRPYPARPTWSAWLLLPYLLAADVQNTLLSALLTFSPKPLYPYYVGMPRLGDLSPTQDQAIAGGLMWVLGSVAFLIPLCWIGVRLLFGEEPTTCHCLPPAGCDLDFTLDAAGSRQAVRQEVDVRVAPHCLSAAEGSLAASRVPRGDCQAVARPATFRFDLLNVPLVGRFLKWRHARLALQLVPSILAAAVIVDGLIGPQVGAMNLAGVLPWIHWRGLVVLGLLALGNVFCMACPFMLPRTLARRFLPAGRNWPRWLRNKWLAVLLLGVFLWAYEAFALWDSPRWTAWIAIGYFAAALVVDGFFRGASFCKYVCPIGQFNFVQSLVSPLEVKVREPAVCTSCATKDCIRGGNDVPGCELHLYQPRKQGNLDCTFCLDCIHACPHDNVGILAVSPGRELGLDPLRSGIGRFSRRPDVAALILVLVCGAFANAAGMIEPVVAWEDQLRASLGFPSLLPITSVFYFSALVAVPLVVVSAAAIWSRRWARLDASWLEVATRYAFALVPLGFGMWLAHYSFHFVTSFDTVIPTTQRFAADMGWTILGEPQWSCSCCRPAADWLPRLQILFLDFGLLLSLYVGYRIATAGSRPTRRVLGAFLPWALVIGLLFAAGVWIVLQPMQMRGTMPLPDATQMMR